MKVRAVCHHCLRTFYGLTGQIGRCSHVFCSRKCAGQFRNLNRTADQKAALKAAYDREYRQNNRSRLKAEKREYFQAREILRTVKTQLSIFSQSGKSVSSELVVDNEENGQRKL